MVNAKKEGGVETERTATEKPNGHKNQQGDRDHGNKRNLVVNVVDLSNLIKGSFRRGHTVGIISHSLYFRRRLAYTFKVDYG